MSRRTPGDSRMRTLRRKRGQATVEFALVVAVLAAVIAGLFLLMQLADRGAFVDAAERSASHIVGTGGLIGDALLY